MITPDAEKKIHRLDKADFACGTHFAVLSGLLCLFRSAPASQLHQTTYSIPHTV